MIPLPCCSYINIAMRINHYSSVLKNQTGALMTTRDSPPVSLVTDRMLIMCAGVLSRRLSSWNQQQRELLKQDCFYTFNLMLPNAQLMSCLTKTMHNLTYSSEKYAVLLTKCLHNKTVVTTVYIGKENVRSTPCIQKNKPLYFCL